MSNTRTLMPELHSSLLDSIPAPKITMDPPAMDETPGTLMDMYFRTLNTISAEDRAAEKQASRDEDAMALASGEKTRAQLWKENTWIPADMTSIDLLSIPIPK